MLYSLFEYLNNNYDITGTGVFQYLSFRAGMAALFSLIISILFGQKIIRLLTKFQLSEKIRGNDIGTKRNIKNTKNNQIRNVESKRSNETGQMEKEKN